MELKQLNDLRIDLSELLEYTEYMNDEFGEYCLALHHIGSLVGSMSAEFVSVYIKEVKWYLAYIKRNTVWHDRKETIVNEFKELEWVSYD